MNRLLRTQGLAIPLALLLFGITALQPAPAAADDLTPEQQTEFMASAPDVFIPAKGAWGRGGSTNVRLASVKTADLQRALLAAWQNKQKRK